MGGLALGNAALQLGTGLYGAYNANQAPQQINPYTDQQRASLEQQYAQQMQMYQAQLQQAQLANQQIQASERQAGAVTDQISRVEQPGAMDWYDNFLGSVPGYQQIASNLAETATSDLGRSINEQVQLDTQQAMAQAMNQFGGQNPYSGAAQAALGQAVAQPMAAGRTQMLGQKADIESGTFNQLAGQGQGLAAQGTQGEFANAMAALNQQLGGIGAQGAMAQGRAQSAYQGAGLAGQMASGAQSGLTQMADPMFRAQQNPFEPIATGANAAFNIATNPSYGLFQPQVGQQQAPTFNLGQQPTYGGSYAQYFANNPYAGLTGR